MQSSAGEHEFAAADYFSLNGKQTSGGNLDVIDAVFAAHKIPGTN